MFKKCFMPLSLLVGTFVVEAVFPAGIFAKDRIIGEVSSVDETSGALTILSDLVEIDASDAKIKKKGADSATLADIEEGDIVMVKGNARSSGTIRAASIKDPVKLRGYDGKITGKTKNVSTSKKTFRVYGQDINAGSLSSVTMGSRAISFNNMRSGVSVDVYVEVRKSGLVAKKVVIRQESCKYCHD